MVRVVVIIDGGDVIIVVVGEAQDAASFEGLCSWWVGYKQSRALETARCIEKA